MYKTIFILILIVLVSGCSYNQIEEVSITKTSLDTISWNGCDELKVDINSFKERNRIYAIDKNFIYSYNSIYGHNECAKIHKTKRNGDFHLLNDKYAKDEKFVYNGKKKLDLDPKFVKIINTFIIKDNISVYINDVKTNLSPSSLDVLNEYVLKDNNSVYVISIIKFKGASYYIHKLENVDPKKFDLKEGFARGEKSIYILNNDSSGYQSGYTGFEIKNVSVSSFDKINSNLYVDSKNLYFYIKKSHLGAYLGDKLTRLEIVTYNQPKEFYVLKDQDNIYFFFDKKLSKILEADVNTFFWNDTSGFGEDENNKYHLKIDYGLKINEEDEKIINISLEIVK